MKTVTLDRLKELMKQSKALTTSNNEFLDQRWASNKSDRHRKYYRFCQLLVKELEPKLVVELGIDEGDCCGHFASGSPATTVIGVDIHKDGEAPSLRCREVERAFPNFKYNRNWTWDAVKTMPSPIDILFIDSWHEFDYFIRDWNEYSKLLVNGSIVIVDDLHVVGNGFDLLPYPKFVDHEIAGGIPFGVLIYDGTDTIIPYKFQPFMPEYNSDNH